MKMSKRKLSNSLPLTRGGRASHCYQDTHSPGTHLARVAVLGLIRLAEVGELLLRRVPAHPAVRLQPQQVRLRLRILVRVQQLGVPALAADVCRQRQRLLAHVWCSPFPALEAAAGLECTGADRH
jgi:hypothetical protein